MAMVAAAVVGSGRRAGRKDARKGFVKLIMHLNTIIFDFDGTLAELRLDFEAMKRGLSALAAVYMGEEPEPSPLPALEWLDELAGEIEDYEGPDLAKEFHTRGRFLILSRELDGARQARLFPSARSVLATLRQRGMRAGVITRNSFSAVTKVFPDWRDHVEVLLAREDVPRVKPDPAHLGEALRRLDGAPESALMVGDHPIDVETGRRLGVPCVGVATGRVSAADLLQAGALHAVDDLDAFLAWLGETVVKP